MAKFSMDTPVKELFENAETETIMKEVFPELVDGPMAGMVKGLAMPLKDIIKFAGGQIPEEKVKELEEKLAALG